MNKRTGIILIIASGLILLAVILTTGLLRSSKSQKLFDGGGYVLDVTQGADNATVAQRFFTENTACALDYPDGYVFTDNNGKSVSISGSGFVHYNDGAHAALSAGMLVDIEELSQGFIGYYSMPADTRMAYDGREYAASNSAGDIFFEQFVWKLGENKYMLVGEDMTLMRAAGDDIKLQDYAEMEYLGDGIARIYNQNGIWQIIAQGSYILFANGVELDLGEKLIISDSGKQIGLVNIEMDSEAAVELKESEIILPEFDITTIDGRDGAAGELGQDGGDGNEGEEGAIGESGTQGNQGSAGADGASGAQGEDGVSGDQVAVGSNSAAPIFRFTEFVPGAAGVSFTVEVQDEDGVLADDPANSVKIYEAGTGKLVWQDTQDGNFANGALTQSFVCTGLDTDTQYRVVVTQSYEMESGGVTVVGTKDFLNRTFYTDAAGVSAKIAYTSQDSITVDLVKADYSEAVTVVAGLFDASGEIVAATPVTQNFAGTAKNARITFGNLVSDTEYCVKLTSITTASGGMISSKNSVSALTLKEEPSELGKPTALVNARGYFELELDGEVIDPDNGIVRYRYDIFETDGTLVKTVYSDTKEPVALYIDEDVIKRNTYYYQKVTVEFHDNAKTLEFECTAPDEASECGYEVFIMRGDGIPVIYFEQTDLHVTTFERITGNIVIDATDCSVIVDAQHPLVITTAAVGDYLGTMQIDSVNLIDGVFRIPVDLQGMKKETTYLFSVTGYTDPYHDGDYKKSEWGSIRHSTTATEPIQLNMEEDGESSGSINAILTIGVEGDMLQTLEASTMTRIVIIMRNAKNTSQILGSEFVLTDNIAEYYHSQLADDYYGTGAKIYLNETSFGLSANSAVLEGVQEVEILVQAIYDYTSSDAGHVSANISGYVNELTFKGQSSVTVAKIPTPPALPNNASLSVTAIQNLQMEIYADAAAPDEDFDNGLIMGYSLAPNYDNSAGLAQRVYYFVYDAVEYRAFLDGLTAEQRTLRDYAPDVNTGKVTVEGVTLLEPLYAWEHELLTSEKGKSELPILNLIFGDGAFTKPTLQTGSAARTNRAVYAVNAGEDIGRGVEYFFTYNVQWYRNSDNTGNYVYPNSHENYGILSANLFDYSNLLQSTGGPGTAGAWAASRQSPAMHIYPYTSDADSIHWRYRVADPDNALAHNYSTEYHDLASNTGTLSAMDITATDAYSDLILSALSANGSSISVLLRMYTCLMYDTRSEETILTQQFEGKYVIQNTGDSEIEIDYSRTQGTNNYLIKVSGLKRDLDKVATIAIRFRQQGDTGDFTDPLFISIDSVEEIENTNGQGILIATLPLSKLDDKILAGVAELNSQITLDTQLFIYYDTGISGLHAVANNILGNDAQGNAITEDSLPDYVYSVKRQDGTYQMLRTAGLSDNADVRNTAVSVSDARRLSAAPVIDEANDSATFGVEGLLTGNHDFVRLAFTKNGAKRTDTTNSVYLLLKRLECINPVVEKVIIVNDLIPSISSRNLSAQIKGIDFTFLIDRGSYELLRVRGNLEIYAQVEKQNEQGTGYIENANKRLVTTLGQWSDAPMTLSITELELGTKYRFKLFYKDGAVMKEIHNTNFTDPPWYTFSTLGQIELTNISSSFNAVDYWNKSLEVTYTLSSSQNTVAEYTLTSDTGEQTSHEQLVASGIIPEERFLITTMSESFKCGPGTEDVFTPGKSYTLNVSIYPRNATGEDRILLGTSNVAFTMPRMQLPAFVVRSIPSVDGEGVHSMSVRITASDNGKTIVTPKNDSSNPVYAVRVKAPDGTVVLDASEVFYQIKNTQVISVGGLQGNTQYTVEIYTVVDTSNSSGRTAINLLPRQEVYNPSNLVYSTVQTTLNDYGIKVGDLTAAQSGSTKLLVRFANGANLENVTMVMYTLTCLDDGTSSSGQSISTSGNLLAQSAGNTYYSMMLNQITLESGKSYALSVALYIGTSLAGQATCTIYN